MKEQLKRLTRTGSFFQKMVTGVMVISGFLLVFFSTSKGSVVTHVTGAGGIAEADAPGSVGASSADPGGGGSSAGCAGCGCSSG